MPSLSVIIPNYNHAQYLPEQLDAILAQSLQPSEIVVIDDASTDKSCEIVTAYQKKYPHISLIRLEKNSGGPEIPLRIGVESIKTDYIIFCASDDLVQPGFFEESMQFVSEHPEVALCFGKCVFFENQKPYHFQELSPFLIHTPRVFSPDEWIETFRKYHLHIPSQSSLFKRSTLLEQGGHDQKLKGYADYYFNYQLAFKYPIAFVPKRWGGGRILRPSYGTELSKEERATICAEVMKKLGKESKQFQKM